METLIEKYPNLFRTTHCDYGCGDGWLKLVESACRLITGLQRQYLRYNKDASKPFESAVCGQSDKPFLDFKFIQIKEKFGGLRMYYDLTKIEHDWATFDKADYDAEFRRLQTRIAGFTDALEVVSDFTCEVCGNRGTKTTSGWIKTLCEEHKRQ
jgi:hypothetical protein